MQLIDGKEITIHQARFTGRLDVPDEEIEKLSLDKVVVMIVSARAGGADLKTLDSGDIRRTDVLKVDDMKVLEGDMRERAIHFLMSGGGYVEFGEPEPDPYDETDMTAAEFDGAFAGGSSGFPFRGLVKEADPELEALLREEEEIERSVRAAQAAAAQDGPAPADLAPAAPPSDAVAELLANAAAARRQAQNETKASGAVAVGEVPVVTRRDPFLDALYKGTDPLARNS